MRKRNMGDEEFLEWMLDQTVANPTTGCVIWGRGYRHGYGYTYHNGKHVSVHRIIWILINGPLEPGECVLHRCDNPPCCRLEHLFVGTQADNMADRDAKGRGNQQGVAGGANGSAKLTQRAVDEIRARYKRGQKPLMRELAAEYGVSRPQISNIVRGEYWRD